MRNLIQMVKYYQEKYRKWGQFYLIGYFGILFLAQIFYGNLVFSSVCGLTILLFTNKFQQYLMDKKRRLLREQFKDLLYSLSASFATGCQLPNALQDAYLNLGFLYNKNSPMMQELNHMNKSIAENRESEDQLLTDFAQRSGVEDIRNFVTVYLSCRVTGGDLNQVVANATKILMGKMAIERDIRVMTSQKQFEGRIISIMPILVIQLLNMVSPEYLDSLYSTIQGRLIMTLALGGIILAYVMTDRIMRIEE